MFIKLIEKLQARCDGFDHRVLIPSSCQVMSQKIKREFAGKLNALEVPVMNVLRTAIEKVVHFHSLPCTYKLSSEAREAFEDFDEDYMYVT